ncbi:MAG: chromosomal replication initiator protein DnaA [Rikenellaceae bacterium]
MSQNLTSYNEIWHNCLKTIKEQTSNEEFVKWFQPIVPISYDGEILRLRVPNESYAKQIERNYILILKPIVCQKFGEHTRLKYAVPVVNNQTNYTAGNATNSASKSTYVNSTDTRNINPFASQTVRKIVVDPQLNFDFTFDNYIQGECNYLARSAAQSISQSPGLTPYNPLFVYGDSGLGKTHLAQAIGIEVKRLYPDKNVLYVSAHKFQAQYTDAVRKKEVNDFIHFYQMIDVLIIDDIQEFAGNKPGTQNTFFNIFNHLFLSKKQLILTCDKSPAELHDIEQRLLTRFKMGLSVRLTSPDFETKVKIIKSKCQRLNVKLSDEIVDFVADNIKANIREIEGAISSFIANATLLGRPVTIELAKEILGVYVNFTVKEINYAQIEEVVSSHFNVSVADLKGKKRNREVVQARQIAMYMCKQHTNMPLKTIGDVMGGKNHATVLHSCKAVNALIETDKAFSANVDQINKKLR